MDYRGIYCIFERIKTPDAYEAAASTNHPRAVAAGVVAARRGELSGGRERARPGIQRQRHRKQPLPLQRQGTRGLHPRHLISRHPRLRRKTLRSKNRKMDRPRSDGGEVLWNQSVCLLCGRSGE